MKKVRIVSEDGLVKNIKFFDTGTGTEIQGVNYLQIGPVQPHDGIIKAQIGLVLPRIDMQVEAELFMNDPDWMELRNQLDILGFDIVKRGNNERN